MANLKFKPGDLVVLKKNVEYRRYPDAIYAQEWCPELRDAIIQRESIRYVAFGSGTKSTQFSGNNPVITAGSVGLVKGYENVFMLDSKRLSDLSNLTLHDRRRNIVEIKKPGRKSYGYVAFLNKEVKRHLQVMIDGRLIAFVSGGPLFELADDTMARYEKATIHFGLDVELHNPNDAQVRDSIQSMLGKLGKLAGGACTLGVTLVRRDGTIETVDPSVIG